MDQFSVLDKKTIVRNVNLASNRDFNHNAIVKNLLGINKVLLLLNEHGDPSFFISNFKFL